MQLPVDPIDSVRLVVSDYMPRNVAMLPLPDGSYLVSRAFYERLISDPCSTRIHRLHVRVGGCS